MPCEESEIFILYLMRNSKEGSNRAWKSNLVCRIGCSNSSPEGGGNVPNSFFCQRP